MHTKSPVIAPDCFQCFRFRKHYVRHTISPLDALARVHLTLFQTFGHHSARAPQIDFLLLLCHSGSRLLFVYRRPHYLHHLSSALPPQARAVSLSQPPRRRQLAALADSACVQHRLPLRMLGLSKGKRTCAALCSFRLVLMNTSRRCGGSSTCRRQLRFPPAAFPKSSSKGKPSRLRKKLLIEHAQLSRATCVSFRLGVS